MTVELIDGHAGKPHISGEDLGDFKAGIVGLGGYVFKTGDVLKATQGGANSVTIGTGSAIMPKSGRHVRVTAPETVAIESGTQGQKRNDVIVLRATTSDDSTSIETASLVVVKGAPSTGTPSDPAVQPGDMKLYRVSLDGVTAAAPVRLFETLEPLSVVSSRFGNYKVLATCNSFMNESDNFKFSEKVSEQPHGIVLCWSFYNGGSVDYSWSYFFVPKEHVSRYSGWGLSNSALFSDYNMVKYVYVGDDFVKGSATNVKNEQMNGLFVHNNKYVLRRVLGV